MAQAGPHGSLFMSPGLVPPPPAHAMPQMQPGMVLQAPPRVDQQSQKSDGKSRRRADSDQRSREKRGSQSREEKRPPKKKGQDPDDILDNLKLEKPLDNTASLGFNSQARTWLKQIEEMELQVHSLTEQAWNFKKKQVKQAMVKMRWGDSALVKNVFAEWQRVRGVLKSERQLFDLRNADLASKGRVAELEARLQQVEGELDEAVKTNGVLEERLMASEFARRRLEKRHEELDASQEAVLHQLQAARQVVEYFQKEGQSHAQIMNNYNYEKAEADQELAAAMQKAQAARAAREQRGDAASSAGSHKGHHHHHHQHHHHAHHAPHGGHGRMPPPTTADLQPAPHLMAAAVQAGAGAFADILARPFIHPDQAQHGHLSPGAQPSMPGQTPYRPPSAGSRPSRR